MHDSTPRRPRFLGSVPETPDVAPLRLARGPGRPPPTVEPAARAAAVRPDRAAQALAAIEGAGAPPPRGGPDCSSREALLRVSAAIETLRAQAAHVAEQARADALEIGFAVARAILATEVRQNPEALFSLVRAAVRRAGDSRRIAVRVAPEDLEVLSEGSRSIDAAAARVELVADRGLCRGDCVVEADFGRIDGRLETRLAELRRAVDAADHERREDVA